MAKPVRNTERPTCAPSPVRKSDRPSCELKTEAEVWIVRAALSSQVESLNIAIARLAERKVPQVHMMTVRRDSVVRVRDSIPEGVHQHSLTNKEQVDRAAGACENFISKLRREQAVDWTPERSAMISIMMPLLDRIRIGWKKPAQIPDEVMAQIKAREGGRFWNDNPGDWLATDEPEDYYVWKQPDWDCVDDWEWKGI